MGEIGHQNMQAPLIAAISPLAICDEAWPQHRELHALHAVFLGTSASPSGNALSRRSCLHSATSSNPAHKTVARCLRWWPMSSSSASLPCREWTPCSIDKDNAGCYRCGASIVGASIIDRQQGAAIRRLDFTDAPGGKGACDRKAVTIKVHMRVTKMSHTPFWGLNLPL